MSDSAHSNSSYSSKFTFLRFPGQHGIFVTSLRGMVYIGYMAFHAFRSYQIKCHYYELGYYRPHFMASWTMDVVGGFTLMCQLVLFIIIPYCAKDNRFVVLLWLELTCTFLIFTNSKVTYRSILLHNIADNLAPIPKELSINSTKKLSEHDFRVAALKRRQIIPSTSYYRVCRRVAVHVNQNVLSAHGAIYIMGTYNYLCEVMMSAGLTSDGMVKSTGMWFVYAFLLSFLFACFFAWFWYENFILKDIGTVYITPWVVFFLILAYGSFTYTTKELEPYFDYESYATEGVPRFVIDAYFGDQQTVPRDFFLGMVLMGFVIKIVVCREVKAEAPAKEEEDDFAFVRTTDYRHIVGTRGAEVDKSSMPSFSISVSSTISERDSTLTSITALFNSSPTYPTTSGNMNNLTTTANSDPELLHTPTTHRRASLASTSASVSRLGRSRMGRYYTSAALSSLRGDSSPKSSIYLSYRPPPASGGERSASLSAGNYLTTDVGKSFRRRDQSKSHQNDSPEGSPGEEINI
ncbi:uncharacterized protein LOC134851632 isoform X2 [Symsagittifera roscoffensis]|uniref:uncharacterized protein LOC134851632 isoform X2 n=1 Tax=Symsagittifera roscoffensis TaxID=84072 RepID=UPI00307BC2AA